MSDTLALRKLRGAFFTPGEICRFVANWAIRASGDRVLEPSCGEAQFLIHAGHRLRSLGARKLLWDDQLCGVEIHSGSAEAAARLLATERLNASIEVGDFFDAKVSAAFDAVIGNPPYVRYQQFTGEARAKALEAALSQGVRLTALASSWAAFVVQSARFLKSDGRLGLVLPAELLAVNYAAQVRRFLLERFGRVRLVMFESRVFPDVLEEVVLLLAEGHGGAKNFEVYQARSISDLETIDAGKWTGFQPEEGDKWTSALLPSEGLAVYRKFIGSSAFAPLLSWGETYLGSVTGNNKYFALTHTEATEFGIRSNELLPISPPGSRHLRGLKFTQTGWDALKTDNARCLLFYPSSERPSAAAQRYIDLGIKKKVHQAYKCENRAPWWRVPMVEAPDLLFTYMNHDCPRLIGNEAGVNIVNSVYGISLRQGFKALGRDLLPMASLNSMTLLGAETVGRAYGGGLLKMEPKEADRLPMPSLQLLELARDDLRAVRPQLSTFMRQGNLREAVRIVDEILLIKHANATHKEIMALRDARDMLFNRRSARGRGVSGEN